MHSAQIMLQHEGYLHWPVRPEADSRMDRATTRKAFFLKNSMPSRTTLRIIQGGSAGRDFFLTKTAVALASQ